MSKTIRCGSVSLILIRTFLAFLQVQSKVQSTLSSTDKIYVIPNISVSTAARDDDYGCDIDKIKKIKVPFSTGKLVQSE